MKNIFKGAMAYISIVFCAVALNVTMAYADDAEGDRYPLPVVLTNGSYELNVGAANSGMFTKSDQFIDHFKIKANDKNLLKVNNSTYIKFVVDRTVDLDITVGSKLARITADTTVSNYDNGKIYTITGTTVSDTSTSTLQLAKTNQKIRLTEGAYIINGDEDSSNSTISAFSLSVALEDNTYDSSTGKGKLL